MAAIRESESATVKPFIKTISLTDPDTTTATTSDVGPPGLPGLQGPPGPSGTSYEHVQSSASSSWIVNHNLGYRPGVTVLNSGSQEVIAEIIHTSVNQVVIGFITPISGLARLT